MINLSDLEQSGNLPFFTTNGRDIWSVVGFFSCPSCTLKNIETNEERTFGIGSLIASDFHKIEMPQEALKKSQEFPNE